MGRNPNSESASSTPCGTSSGSGWRRKRGKPMSWWWTTRRRSPSRTDSRLIPVSLGFEQAAEFSAVAHARSGRLPLGCWLGFPPVDGLGFYRRPVGSDERVAYKYEFLQFAQAHREKRAGSRERTAGTYDRAGAAVQPDHRGVRQWLARAHVVQQQIFRIAHQEGRSAGGVHLHVNQIEERRVGKEC